MIEFEGTYFDGKSSRPYPVSIFFDGRRIRIQGEDGYPDADVSFRECAISAPLGKTRRGFRLPDGALCETDDPDAMALIESYKGENIGMRFVHFLESGWTMAGTCLLALIFCVWLFMSYGIPFLAQKAARALPPALLEKVSDKTLESLDKRFFRPSELAPEKAEEIRGIFRSVSKEIGTGFDYRLVFRKSPMMGANAFALPSGKILMTDELIELAENDKELIGVMAHEMAHVENRHGLRSVIQNAGVFLLISALVGDVTSITSMAATLPTVLAESGYSRKFEREADEAAGLYLIRKGWSTKPYQDILIRLTKGEKHHRAISLISTHPETRERVALLQELEKK